MNNDQTVRCPQAPRFPGDLTGCGSTNVTQPDDEGFHDCCNCGLFFKGNAVDQAPSACAIRG
jgi:hypothetical protein